ncbi:hypothetical protein CICLE_v10003284mg [Citrus x clementina]|uniref:TF-B3 domain-containing protein n=1 Tax=Citrus clementina TaxID=85681 RepID=V4SZT5_CITCL|nr:hypothetical protein CICLE_v10003284mg [Citrus x clementina]GAY64251.1 hypothetical protein CUMW_232100 [Citrus unshiu]
MAVYSKILTATDVSNQLEVKSSWINDLFPAFEAGQYHQDLVVEDEKGEKWEFVLRIRQKKHKKPSISQATWHPFVVAKQAEVDDRVEFSRKTDGATGSACRYKIRVIKKVKKEVMENEGKEVIKNEGKEVKLFGVIIGHA